MKIPLDIVHPELLPQVINEILNEPADGSRGADGSRSTDNAPGTPTPIRPAAAPDTSVEGKNIVLLSLWDLLRARHSKEYRAFLEKAALVLPISKSLISGARFLTGKTPCRYMPFNFAVSLLAILENREFTAYLLGSRTHVLERAERNIRMTFPHLRLVGRYVGYFRKQEEPGLLEAIRKAAPHLLLVGRGVRGEELWISRRHQRLGHGIRFWCSDLFEVFAGVHRRPSQTAFDYGIEGIGYCVRSPWRVLRIFPYLWYKLLLVVYKISGKR